MYKRQALGGLFGGVEGVEDALGVGQPGAVVGDGHLDVLFAAARVNHDVPTLPRILYRVVRVVQDIQEDLL